MFCKVNEIGLNANGDCIKLSIVITAFVLETAICNSCAFPVPTPTNVIPVPASANVLEVAIKNVSVPSLIANTGLVSELIPPPPSWYCIGVDPTPTNVEFGLYINSSPVLKKWSLILNLPETRSTVSETAGLNDLAKIGVALEVNVKFFLLILSPLIAL